MPSYALRPLPASGWRGGDGPEKVMAPRPRFEKDYYTLMGLRPEATEEEVRKAYRRLALQWHPDRNPGDPRAAERFREISEAYAVLIDPAKRREYDVVRGGGAPGEFRHKREDLFRDLFADPRASAIFEEIRRELERMGMRVDHRYFRETLLGGRVVVTGGIFIISPFTPVLALLRLARAALRAARAEPVGAPRTRPLPPTPGVLGALGRVGRRLLGLSAAPSSARALDADDVILPLRLTRAEAERGAGKHVALDGDSEILVTVPSGTRPGTRLRLRGKGRPRPDGSRGDAYLAVEITE